MAILTPRVFSVELTVTETNSKLYIPNPFVSSRENHADGRLAEYRNRYDEIQDLKIYTDDNSRDVDNKFTIDGDYWDSNGIDITEIGNVITIEDGDTITLRYDIDTSQTLFDISKPSEPLNLKVLEEAVDKLTMICGILIEENAALKDRVTDLED